MAPSRPDSQLNPDRAMGHEWDRGPGAGERQVREQRESNKELAKAILQSQFSDAPKD